MNYTIINDKSILINFIKNFLPELPREHKFIVSLFARNKYTDNPKLKANKSLLRRFVSDKEKLLNQIEQLEVPLGAYKCFTHGKTPIEVPQESLALYINPNPRDLKKATYTLGKKIFDLLKMDANFNIANEVFSQIQKASGKKIFMDFDFDEVDLNQTIKTIKEQNIINIDALHILQTRGGFHILVNISKVKHEYVNTWYKSMSILDGIDISGDNMIPVPGSFQGGFTPIFVNI